MLGCPGNGASPAPLSVLTLTPAATFVREHPNEGIVLQDNVIEGAAGLGLFVTSSTNVRVANNRILGANAQPPLLHCGMASPLPVDAASLFALGARNVTFQGNTREGGAGLVIDPTCVGCSGQDGGY